MVVYPITHNFIQPGVLPQLCAHIHSPILSCMFLGILEDFCEENHLLFVCLGDHFVRITYVFRT